MTGVRMPIADRIQRGPGCWAWRGAHGADGYAVGWVGGRVRRAHLITYEMLVGPVPVGLEIDHLCRNRGCVNPDHLEPVTHAENVRRSPLVTARQQKCQRGHCDWLWHSGKRYCRSCANAGRRVRRALAREETA